MHPTMHRTALIVQIQKMPAMPLQDVTEAGASVPGDVHER
jgi:hypothetical protein